MPDIDEKPDDSVDEKPTSPAPRASGTADVPPPPFPPHPPFFPQQPSVLLRALRSLLVPLAESYAHSPSGTAPLEPAPNAARLTPAELEILGRAGSKATLELGELLSKNFPATPDGSRPDVALGADGRYPEWSASHLVSAVKAAGALFSSLRGDAAGKASLGAFAAGEVGPVPLSIFRLLGARAADSYASNPNPVLTMPPSRPARQLAAQYLSSSEYRYRPSAPYETGGCACGRATPCPRSHVPGAGCVPGYAPRNPVTGKCAPSPWQPSCETQARLAGCLKAALCDFLRKLEEPLADKQGLELAALARMAALSALACLPEALCPSEPAPCRRPPLDCDFAVEEPEP